MKKPVCPNCKNVITISQLIKEILPFNITCQHCNHELNLTLRWRILVFMEFLVLGLSSYFSHFIREFMRFISGHPFSTVGSCIALVAVVAFLTWNSVQYEMPPK